MESIMGHKTGLLAKWKFVSVCVLACCTPEKNLNLKNTDWQPMLPPPRFFFFLVGDVCGTNNKIISIFYWVSSTIFWNCKETQCVFIFVFIFWMWFCPDLCITLSLSCWLCPSAYLLCTSFKPNTVFLQDLSALPALCSWDGGQFFPFNLPLCPVSGSMSCSEEMGLSWGPQCLPWAPVPLQVLCRSGTE